MSIILCRLQQKQRHLLFCCRRTCRSFCGSLGVVHGLLKNEMVRFLFISRNLHAPDIPTLHTLFWKQYSTQETKISYVSLLFSCPRSTLISPFLGPKTVKTAKRCGTGCLRFSPSPHIESPATRTLTRTLKSCILSHYLPSLLALSLCASSKDGR